MVIAGPGAAGSATLVAIEIVEGMPSVSVSNASPAWTAWVQRSDSMVNPNWTSIVPVSATFTNWRDLAISTTWTSAFYRLVQQSLAP